ncbi:metal ABC transporter substrate-binding protein [Pseudomonas gingeri NCPPB 3146 = LMG 5327]|uniref:Metal ABC transporter substrate-binding protein n=2 Tax=Pseudomonas gingeri TaxID=117681 RepID=A0A7Y7XXL3_9PSED|nr:MULTISPECIES: metal ABC transporter substrate-binding protein [Pseudomonas]NVZ29037.1 metal ABC transporter substrate-binding protein [Pseudomonas gingeri]NVZ63135.1 metal ABC transporter substrate-binding protein [Pseudomonas gingeri]NVZ78754.1 metal ABC transporter substrate-binding protein [Pseudomonas gingeri]NWA07162.1 metal ABC transporter substrate-binding protein [Pseudomonas gingeri]NWC14205.1 metal ABC transporter substrate-binding protein [Pseudomonas gingeri]
MRALLVLFSSMLALSLNLSSAQAADKLPVVASFSILRDITQQIGGDHIEVTGMVGPDADAHTYEPTPDDAKALLKAKLIVKNGLGFEPWLDRLVTSTETKATVVTASKGVISHTMEEDGETIPDPHAWHNLANAELYVNNITKALIQVDPANKDDYTRNSQAYLKQIYRLLAEAKVKLGNLPAGNRRIVTSHDAFGYLGQAYGIQFLAPQGLSTEREPSAAEVATLITQIRKDKVKAVFMENIKDARLLKQIADESGAQIGGTLYSDALAAEGPASTFTGLFEYNMNTLHAALSK